MYNSPKEHIHYLHMPNFIKNLAVIGGGASGMAAAVAYMQGGGRDAVIIEAQQRIGRKLLSTGNGRCNITNAAITPDSYRTERKAYICLTTYSYHSKTPRPAAA